MSGRFISVKLFPPPVDRTLQVRSGGSIFSAALSSIPELGWTHVCGCHSESMPRPPDEWWLRDEEAEALGIDINAVEAKMRAQRKPAQAVLDFSGDDSGQQSKRATGDL